MKTFVKYIKMPFGTKIFRKNQKVWIKYTTGASAVNVCGKYRGKGRYVTGWVNYASKEKKQLMTQAKCEIIETEKDFAERHGLCEYEKPAAQSTHRLIWF